MSPERIENAVELPPFRVPANWYGAQNPRATLLLVPALGVVAGYYGPLANCLSDRGIQVLVPELPGTGNSRPRPSRSADYGYGDLVGRYLAGLVDVARHRGGEGPLILAGHSLGAQVVALATLHGKLDPDAVVSIAGGWIHYRLWPGVGRAAIFGLATAVSLLTHIFGYLPGQLVGFGEVQARSLMRQWSHAVRRGRYPGFEPAPERTVAAPALSVCYEGDRYAPRASAAALAGSLAGDLHCLGGDRPGNPHTSWARHPESTVECIDDWLTSTRVAPSVGN